MSGHRSAECARKEHVGQISVGGGELVPAWPDAYGDVIVPEAPPSCSHGPSRFSPPADLDATQAVKVLIWPPLPVRLLIAPTAGGVGNIDECNYLAWALSQLQPHDH
jgi:hypothetical protein